MKLEALPHLCQSYGNCVAIDPGHVDLDDDDIVYVTNETVTEDELKTVQASIRSCPVNALKLVGADNE